MTNSIFVAVVFALAFIANLSDLIVNAPKIEDEEKRKKRTIRDVLFTIVWGVLLIFRIIYIMHLR